MGGDMDATNVAMCDLEDRVARETGFSEQALRQLMKEAFLLEMERKRQMGEAMLSGKVAPLAVLRHDWAPEAPGISSAEEPRASPARAILSKRGDPVPECLATLHVQVGINNAATPAPPIAPTANTNTAITALASRLYLLGTLDMASSLITIPVPPPQTACS
jgi:hypothetical protein